MKFILNQIPERYIYDRKSVRCKQWECYSFSEVFLSWTSYSELDCRPLTIPYLVAERKPFHAPRGFAISVGHESGHAGYKPA